MDDRFLSRPLLKLTVAILVAVLAASPTIAFASVQAGLPDDGPRRTATDEVVIAPEQMQAMIDLGIVSQDACAAAQVRGRDDVNGTLWLAGGCLLGILAVGAAYLIEPSPPAAELVGKDAQYVATYTDCYQDAAQSKQTKQALYGCLAGAVAYVGLYAVAFAAAAATY